MINLSSCLFTVWRSNHLCKHRRSKVELTLPLLLSPFRLQNPVLNSWSQGKAPTSNFFFFLCLIVYNKTLADSWKVCLYNIPPFFTCLSFSPSFPNQILKTSLHDVFSNLTGFLINLHFPFITFSVWLPTWPFWRVLLFISPYCSKLLFAPNCLQGKIINFLN